jgi:flagellin
LKSQIRSLNQANRNANDGISLTQTAEGALTEISNILVRLRELSVQASNGTVSGADKDTLNQEFQSLIDEIDRISQSTGFNGVNLLDGSTTSINFQIGFGTTAGVDTLNVTLGAALATSLVLSTLDIGSTGSQTTAITRLDTAIDTISALRGRLGSVQNRLNSTINNLSIQVENLSAANSRIRDVDVAFETAVLTRNAILQQSSLSILAQANVAPQAALSLLGR